MIISNNYSNPLLAFILLNFAMKNSLYIGIGVILLVLSLLTISLQNSYATLPTSIVGTYKITANGFTGTLIISSVDVSGKVTGTITFTGEPTQNIVGLWNSAGQELTFIRIRSTTDPSFNQVYTGYRFCVPLSCSSATNTIYFAGTFQVQSANAGGTPAKHVVRWVATTTHTHVIIP